MFLLSARVSGLFHNEWIGFIQFSGVLFAWFVELLDACVCGACVCLSGGNFDRSEFIVNQLCSDGLIICEPSGNSFISMWKPLR